MAQCKQHTVAGLGLTCWEAPSSALHVAAASCLPRSPQQGTCHHPGWSGPEVGWARRPELQLSLALGMRLSAWCTTRRAVVQALQSALSLSWSGFFDLSITALTSVLLPCSPPVEDYEPSYDLSGISSMSEAVRITGREMPPTENINQTLGENYSWLVSALEPPDAAACMLQVPSLAL